MKFRRFLAFAVSLCMVLAAAPQALTAEEGDAADGPPIYRLDAGDRVKVTVYGEQSVNGEYAIGPEGDIAFPLIGNVLARQQTVEELRRAIVARLAEGYLVDPRVTIEVLTYRPYYIFGEVGRPGQYAYVNGLSVDQAIATAGGYTYRASKKKVFIRPAGGAEIEVKLTRDKPLWVNPGDTIRIGERYF